VGAKGLHVILNRLKEQERRFLIIVPVTHCAGAPLDGGRPLLCEPKDLAGTPGRLGRLRMRMILIATATLALAACGGGNKSDANSTNNLSSNGMVTNTTTTTTMDQNAMMGTNDMMATNGAMGMNGSANMSMNGSVNSATMNAMEKDMKTNDKDTNLANGI
jgi:hypothetical protein